MPIDSLFSSMPTTKKYRVCVIGLGYVGLPLAVQAALKGCMVWGVEINEDIIKMVNEREVPYYIDKWLDLALKKVSKKQLIATNDSSVISEADVIIICVQTPTVNNIPNLSFVEQASELVGRHLKKGQLVTLESTVNPGVTRDTVLPALERTSGLKGGKDFYLAHCPERIDPGNKHYHVDNINRVIGGINEVSTAKIAHFYKNIIDGRIVQMDSAEEAEFVKSWENTLRNVMIALANSAAIISDSLSIDVTHVIEGMQSKIDQFGLQLAKPGIGPGGHCIPEDIHFVIKNSQDKGINSTLLQASADLNDNMPLYALNRIEARLLANSLKIQDLTVGLLGLSYKPEIGDSRKSPAIKLGELLAEKCKNLIVHDPFVPYDQSVLGATRFTDVNRVLEDADIICLATAHQEYIDALTPRTLKDKNIKLVFDGRNVLKKEAIIAHKILYIGIGR